MRRLILLLGVVGCSYEQGVLPDGQTETITVGFDSTMAVPADEAVGTVSLPVVLSGPSSGQVTVDYRVTGGTAMRGSDFVLADGTLTFAAGMTKQTIDVMIVNDTIEEPDETIVVTLSMPVGATLGTSDRMVNIAANILARVSFADPTASSALEATSPSVELVLTMPAPEPVTVELSVAGTATPGVDDGVTDGQVVSFAVGETSKLVPLNVVEDLLDENDETVQLGLKNPTGKLLVSDTNNTKTHTITDDDLAPDVGFSPTAASVNEADTNVTVTVQLTAVSGLDVTVPFTINAASTALSPDDYTTTATSPLSIPAGMQSATFTLAVKQDVLDEDNETIGIDLGTPTNATLAVGATSYTCTINDDDPLPKVSWDSTETDLSEAEGSAPPGPGTRTVLYHLVLDAPSGRTVQVPIIYTGTATKDTDYFAPDTVQIDPGVTSVSVTLTIVKDTTKESNTPETIVMTIPTSGIINAQRQMPTVRTYSIIDDD